MSLFLTSIYSDFVVLQWAIWYDRYQGPGQSADQYQQGQQVLYEFDTILVRKIVLMEDRKPSYSSEPLLHCAFPPYSTLLMPP